MIAASRQWFRRNRTNFAIGAGVLGAGYLATQYVLGKVTETRQRMSDERIAKENLRRRFEQNQEDCTFTVLAILPTAVENIFEALPVEQVLEELQAQRQQRLARSVGGGPSEVSTADLASAPPSLADGGDDKSLASESFIHTSQMAESSLGTGESPLSPPRTKRNKVQLWNEVKISSISRAFTLIYTLSLLTLLTRIQLNLLGRRNYLASVVSLASPPKQDSKINLENRDDDNFEQAYGNDFETNRKYLSFSWWLLHRGCKDIMENVTAAVKEVFGPLNPREDITLQRLSELTVLVRKKIEGFTEEDRKTRKWLTFLLPPGEEEDYVLHAAGMSGPSDVSATTSPALRRLLDETSDLIDSPPFAHVLTLLLDSAFSLLIDTKIATLAYKIPPPSASGARVVEIVGPGTDVKAKVASTLATFSRQAHSIGSGGNNEYLTTMEGVRDLEAFAAVVYSSNFEFEAPEAAASLSATSLGDQPSAPSSYLGGTSTANATPAPSGVLKAADPEEPVGGEASLIDAGEVDLEKAWGKAVAKEDGK